MTTHKKARQYSDQIYCSQCGKSWDVNDQYPPDCISNHDLFLQKRELLKQVNENERRSAKSNRRR